MPNIDPIAVILALAAGLAAAVVVWYAYTWDDIHAERPAPLDLADPDPDLDPHGESTE